MTSPRRLTLLLSLLLLTGATTFVLDAGGTNASHPVTPDRDEVDTAMICRVHHQTLVSEEMRIIYGLPVPDPAITASFRVADSLFPHAVPHIFGGCIIDENSPLTRTVLFCPTCRMVRAAWMNGYQAGTQRDEN